MLAVLFVSLAAAGPMPKRYVCDAELRSWVVLARGRHLYLEIKNLPEAHAPLRSRIEFTSAHLRHDYQHPSRTTQRSRASEGDSSGGMGSRSVLPVSPGETLPRVARMTRGSRLFSPLAQPRDRLEARYKLTLAQLESLQRDRLFTAAYELTGPNSNAALRRVMESVGLRLPARVTNSGGLLGEFPGIDASVGAELPASRWREFGVPSGPAPLTPRRR